MALLETLKEARFHYDKVRVLTCLFEYLCCPLFQMDSFENIGVCWLQDCYYLQKGRSFRHLSPSFVDKIHMPRYQLCCHLKDIVDTTASLRYIIELGVAGMCDGPPNAVGPTERLGNWRVFGWPGRVWSGLNWRAFLIWRKFSHSLVHNLEIWRCWGATHLAVVSICCCDFLPRHVVSQSSCGTWTWAMNV